MGLVDKIKGALHTVKTGVGRLFAESLPAVPEEKAFGNYYENEVYDKLKNKLPDAKIIQNVCLDKDEARGEIDFLIVFGIKVFVVELKTWKGTIVQKGNDFYQIKESESGNEYEKKVSSPFKQIDRNVYLLKQQFPKIWFEKAILFYFSNRVNINNDHAWFTNTTDLVDYIKSHGKTNYRENIRTLLQNIHSYDCMYSKTLFYSKEKHCIIDEDSLTFEYKDKTYTKKDISEITVLHHFSYDYVTILLKDKSSFVIKSENKNIKYMDNGRYYEVALNKLDRIIIG